MKLGILTSSRADFGIYVPLIKELNKDDFFDVEIIAFGSHLSEKFGFTITEIESTLTNKIHRLAVEMYGENPASIAKTYSETCAVFTEFWSNTQFDVVLCLGDRYEMNAAVQSSIPFRVKLAHLHGGETTLGAIDNVYRHQISLASDLHFTATESAKERLISILDSDESIFNVGSVSLDDIQELELPEFATVQRKFSLPEKPYVLCTFHPETDTPHLNHQYVEELKTFLINLAKLTNIVITLPNADTNGNIYRDALFEVSSAHSNMVLVEHFGRLNYFTAMKNATCLIGNTSSGIIEAASFKKYVINVGSRQKGRARSENTIDVPFRSETMMTAYSNIPTEPFEGTNVYKGKDAVGDIIKTLKKYSLHDSF